MLVFGLIKDGGAVAGALVRALPVQLRGVMRDREEDAQERAVGDPGRIERHLDRFGMACGFSRHLVVGGGCGRAAGITGFGMRDALDTLEDGLCTPEAAASKDRFLHGGTRGERVIGLGRWDRSAACGGNNGHVSISKEDGAQQQRGE